jgi:hypothetical protein
LKEKFFIHFRLLSIFVTARNLPIKSIPKVRRIKDL